MADEADMSDGYAEAMVEEGLTRVRRKYQEAPPTKCEDCGKTPHKFGNGVTSRYCGSCLEERGFTL